MTRFSFCIPTYNRYTELERLVKSILVIDDHDIEVIVLDNDSSDGTCNLLKSIQDNRVKIFKNTSNMGALYNMVNVFSNASGDYLIYTTDQDYFNASQFAEFVNFILENPAVGFGHNNIYNSKPSGYNSIYRAGFSAGLEFSYIGIHPTGYFFKKSIHSFRNTLNIKLSSIIIVKNISSHNSVS